ncbi:hypothetical protein ACU8KH_01649 [Lachancea thermotolerans]
MCSVSSKHHGIEHTFCQEALKRLVVQQSCKNSVLHLYCCTTNFIRVPFKIVSRRWFLIKISNKAVIHFSADFWPVLLTLPTAIGSERFRYYRSFLLYYADFARMEAILLLEKLNFLPFFYLLEQVLDMLLLP